MVSFGVVSLFTRVPIRKTMSLLGRHFKEGILTLFRHVLTSSYFSFAGKFYKQIDGVAMGSPLSPVITNFYMEDFEEMALDRALYKPLCCFHYVGDTFVIWPLGPNRLRDFLDLPFLDIDIYWRPDGSLGHRVYHKPTHTNLYLNSSSHHHPSNKHAVLSTLVHRVRTLGPRQPSCRVGVPE
jgi:hypothetical protein